jgi:hypothetical protein
MPELPNRVMDKEVAELVGRAWNNADGWSPSSNLAHAWEAVEAACKKLNCDFKLTKSPLVGVLARFEVGKRSSGVTMTRHSAPEPAICEAVMTAFREVQG